MVHKRDRVMRDLFETEQNHHQTSLPPPRSSADDGAALPPRHEGHQPPADDAHCRRDAVVRTARQQRGQETRLRSVALLKRTGERDNRCMYVPVQTRDM